MATKPWDEWVADVRVAIYAASIVRQAHDKQAEGRGAPTAEDMKLYTEEAAALVDLWEDGLPP